MSKNIVLGIALVAAGASADTSVTYLGEGIGQTTRVRVSDGLRGDMGLDPVLGDGNVFNVFAGGLEWDLTSLDLGNPVTLFCIELEQPLGEAPQDFNYAISSLDQAQALGGNLVGIEDEMARLFEHGYNEDMSAVDSAAFQAVIWDLIYDDLDGHNAGDMKFRNENGNAFGAFSDFHVAFNNFAEIMLNEQLSVSGYVFALTSEAGQDQVMYSNTLPPALIPLPSAGLLAAAGLGLVARRRVR